MKQHLEPQKRRAKQIGMYWVKDIKLSPLKYKRCRIIFNDDSHIDYGTKNISDYLIHKSDARRKKFFIIVFVIIRVIMILGLAYVIRVSFLSGFYIFRRSHSNEVNTFSKSCLYSTE